MRIINTSTLPLQWGPLLNMKIQFDDSLFEGDTTFPLRGLRARREATAALPAWCYLGEL